MGTLRAVKGDPFKHNAVAQVHLAGVMKDRGDTHPDRRYKMITFVDSPRNRRGYHTLVSGDGLNWQHFSRETLAPGFGRRHRVLRREPTPVRRLSQDRHPGPRAQAACLLRHH